MLNSISRLLPAILLIVMMGVAGCAGTGAVGPSAGQTAEQFMDESQPQYNHHRRYRLERDLYRGMKRGPGYLTLVQLNPACDGMALQFRIKARQRSKSPLGRREPIVRYNIFADGLKIGSGETNRTGNGVIDFQGHASVTMEIDEGLMWSMRTTGHRGQATARPEVEVGTYDHDRVLMRYGTYRLGGLLETGEYTIRFRGSEDFCDTPGVIGFNDNILPEAPPREDEPTFLADVGSNSFLLFCIRKPLF